MSETNGGRRNGDPSPNVLDLVDKEAQRQDDLRKADARRINELAVQERRHRIEIRDLETKFRDAQQVAEKQRIDGQRQEDKGNVALALQSADAARLALAATVDATAKALAASGARSGISTQIIFVIVALVATVGGVLIERSLFSTQSSTPAPIINVIVPTPTPTPK